MYTSCMYKLHVQCRFGWELSPCPPITMCACCSLPMVDNLLRLIEIQFTQDVSHPKSYGATQQSNLGTHNNYIDSLSSSSSAHGHTCTFTRSSEPPSTGGASGVAYQMNNEETYSAITAIRLNVSADNFLLAHGGGDKYDIQ